MIEIPKGYTPGPWLPVQKGNEVWDEATTEHVGLVAGDVEVINGCGECGSPFIVNPIDLKLMALAPALADEVIRLRAEIEEMMGEIH